MSISRFPSEICSNRLITFPHLIYTACTSTESREEYSTYRCGAGRSGQSTNGLGSSVARSAALKALGS